MIELVEAVIFTGVPASGKSTYFKQKFFDSHVRINLDMLRTRHREALLLRACLEAVQPFVVDNTNVLPAERKVYIDAARSARFRVIGYYFRTELRAAIGRNKQRAGKQAVPVPGLIAKWKRMEPPTYVEGYDELFTVDLTDTLDFVTAPVVRYSE